MQQTIKILCGVLVVQAALVLWLNMGGESLTAFTSDEPLLAVDFHSIDKIEIGKSAEKGITLAKKDGKWVLPEHHDFPVAKRKFEEVVKKLTELKTAWPVARTAIAAKQFKLTEDDHERKVVFHQGDQAVATLMLGTSPGFRKIHGKLGNRDEIMPLELNAYDLPVDFDGWYDRALLQVPKDDLKEVSIGGLTFKSTDKGTELGGLAENEETKKTEADQLVTKLSGLSFEGLLGVEEKPEYKLDKPQVSWTITRKDGDKKVEYKAAGPYEENFYVVKSSEHPYYLKARKQQFEKLDKIERAAYVQPKKVEEPPAQESALQTPSATGTPAP